MPEYVSGWYGHGFESHSQPFLLTYPEVDLSLWRFVFYFQTPIKRYFGGTVCLCSNSK